MKPIVWKILVVSITILISMNPDAWELSILPTELGTSAPFRKLPPLEGYGEIFAMARPFLAT